MCNFFQIVIRQAHHERIKHTIHSSWGKRTPPTYKLASGIFVLSVDSWITRLELVPLIKASAVLGSAAEAFIVGNGYSYKQLDNRRQRFL